MTSTEKTDEVLQNTLQSVLGKITILVSVSTIFRRSVSHGSGSTIRFSELIDRRSKFIFTDRIVLIFLDRRSMDRNRFQMYRDHDLAQHWF
jgi:hypothetical protein